MEFEEMEEIIEDLDREAGHIIDEYQLLADWYDTFENDLYR